MVFWNRYYSKSLNTGCYVYMVHIRWDKWDDVRYHLFSQCITLRRYFRHYCFSYTRQIQTLGIFSFQVPLSVYLCILYHSMVSTIWPLPRDLISSTVLERAVLSDVAYRFLHVLSLSMVYYKSQCCPEDNIDHSPISGDDGFKWTRCLSVITWSMGYLAILLGIPECHFVRKLPICDQGSTQCSHWGLMRW